MNESIQDKLKHALQAAEGLYYRLVLLVGETGSGKTRTLRDFAGGFNTSIVNINLAISSQLLDLTTKQRSLRLPEILEEIVEDYHSPVVLDNLEILFDRDLKQDPLRLLQGIARNRSVIASWNGSYDGGRLLYAKMSHPEYRNYENVGVIIVSMDGNSTVDSVKNNLETGPA